MKQIKAESSIIEIKLQEQYRSAHDFHDVFSKILGHVPQKEDKNATLLKASWIDTALGPMIAIADNTFLYLLEFMTRKGLEQEINRLRQRGFVISPGSTLAHASIEFELKAYFEGQLTQFKTPYRTFGSPFQQQVWQALCQIPYGETRSYKDQSLSLGKPKGYRAVANANGSNQLAIIIPCHRVIASDGSLGGYGGGLIMKQRLIKHEKQHKTK